MLDAGPPLTAEEQRAPLDPIDPTDVDFDSCSRLATAALANLVALAQDERERRIILAEVRSGQFDWAIDVITASQPDADFDLTKAAFARKVAAARKGDSSCKRRNYARGGRAAEAEAKPKPPAPEPAKAARSRVWRALASTTCLTPTQALAA